MPRPLQLLLLVSVLAAPPCASPAVCQEGPREPTETPPRAVEGEEKKDQKAWFRLGIEYNRAGDVEKAREAFKQALKLNRRFTAARAGLAYTFFVEKNFKEAEKEAYQAVILTPAGSSDSLAHRVLAAIRTQRYRELALGALAQAEQALAKSPDAPDWNLLKAEALIGLYISEETIPPDLSYDTSPPRPDEATQQAARDEARRRTREAVACLEKYLSLARPVANEAYLRGQLEALRFYSQDPESLPAADRPYGSTDVSSRAVIRHKPEPGFTEEARKAGLVGMVRLRAVLTSDGKIKHILVIMPLRYGLTEQTLKAAREIKFTPANINGTPVSQYVILEYNFTVY